MNTFEEQIAIHYNWTVEYCNKVIFEYERFLHMKFNNPNICGSDDIYKLWQYHILSTESYYNYCMSKFNKIIHHTMDDNIDNIKKDKDKYIRNLLNTYNCYKNSFGTFINKNVWNFNFNGILLDDIEKIQQSNYHVQLPSYEQNKPEKGQLKFYIWYNNQITAGLYNKNIIELKPSITDSLYMLKNYISLNLKIKKEQIKIFPHNDIPSILWQQYSFNGELNDYTLIIKLINIGCDFFLIEIN